MTYDREKSLSEVLDKLDNARTSRGGIFVSEDEARALLASDENLKLHQRTLAAKQTQLVQAKAQLRVETNAVRVLRAEVARLRDDSEVLEQALEEARTSSLISTVIAELRRALAAAESKQPTTNDEEASAMEKTDAELGQLGIYKQTKVIKVTEHTIAVPVQAIAQLLGLEGEVHSAINEAGNEVTTLTFTVTRRQEG